MLLFLELFASWVSMTQMLQPLPMRLMLSIDKRYELHATQLATRGDVDTVRKEMAEMKTELIKAIAESQRWTITAIFAAVGVFAALSKVLH